MARRDRHRIGCDLNGSFSLSPRVLGNLDHAGFLAGRELCEIDDPRD
jgi:hypothetical protein